MVWDLILMQLIQCPQDTKLLFLYNKLYVLFSVVYFEWLEYNSSTTMHLKPSNAFMSFSSK